MTEAASPFRIAGQDPPEEPEKRKTYCNRCHYLDRDHNGPDGRHSGLWKCNAPTEEIDPQTGELSVPRPYCDKKNTDANCGDYIYWEDMKTPNTKRPWWKLWGNL